MYRINQRVSVEKQVSVLLRPVVDCLSFWVATFQRHLTQSVHYKQQILQVTWALTERQRRVFLKRQCPSLAFIPFFPTFGQNAS